MLQLGALGLAGASAARARKLHASQAKSDEAQVESLRTRAVLEGPIGLELASIVGTKAAALGEVVRVVGRERVPAWFCVTQAAFQRTLSCPVTPVVLEQLGMSGKGVPDLAAAISVVLERELSSLKAAEAIRRLWRSTPLPADFAEEIGAAYRRLAPEDNDPFVAVRSSGGEEDSDAAAWAGQFDTFLFVRGERELLEHIRLAWAGFWTARAIEHRRALRGAPVGFAGGVMVQRMADARVSGVLHTVAAATGQLNDMLINVGLGLGEGVVSGIVEVDNVLVSKASDVERGELDLRYTIGEKREQVVRDVDRGVGTCRRETLYHQRLRPALEYVEICELVSDARRLEAAFVRPLDIEFAFEGVKLYVLQARPIAALEAAWAETATRHPFVQAKKTNVEVRT
jgi:pyruvate,water dikinase